MASTACPVSVQSVFQYYAIKQPTPVESSLDFHLIILLCWAAFMIATTAVPYLYRTSWSQLTGFMIATVGTVVIFFAVGADNLHSKREQSQLADQLTVINKLLDDDKTPAAERVAKTLEKQQNVDRADDLATRIDLAGILTNFGAMTLGGVGAGLLTTMITANKRREDEVEEEQRMHQRVANALHLLFGLGAASAMAGILSLATSRADTLVGLACQPHYIAALLGFVAVALTAFFGFFYNLPGMTKEPKLVGLGVATVGILFVQIKAISLVAPDMGGSLLITHLLTVPLLLHKSFSERLRMRSDEPVA